MLAPKEDLSTRTYNVHAMSFTPEEIFEEVTSDEPCKALIVSCPGKAVGARVNY